MSNKYNALNTSTIAPYINSQIDSRLKRSFKVHADSVLEINEVFKNDLAGGTSNAIPKASSNVVTHFTGVSGSGL